MVTRSLLVAAIVLLGSCTSVPSHPRLTVAEVVRLADAEARGSGYDLREYQRPQVHYNYVTANDTWWVSYDQIYVNGLGEVGKHFSVTIEDKTKKLWLMPGR